MVSSNAPRRDASPPRPLRAPPRLAIRRGVTGHLCQIKFWLMHIKHSRCWRSAGTSILFAFLCGHEPTNHCKFIHDACEQNYDRNRYVISDVHDGAPRRRPQPLLTGASWQSGSISALLTLHVGRKWRKPLSHTHRRTECSLVALPPFPDLFSHAKDLLIEAMAANCH
jgi:hypothetical protein